MVTVSIMADTPEEVAAALHALAEPQKIAIDRKELAKMLGCPPTRGSDEDRTASSGQRFY